jgi:DNA-directed RNA polymerase subunit RPC12/RpoP
MPEKCPKCGTDLLDTINEAEIWDISSKEREIECPCCDAKITVATYLGYDLSCAKGTFVCPHCGDDEHSSQMMFDIHVQFCGKKPQSNNDKATTKGEQ